MFIRQSAEFFPSGPNFCQPRPDFSFRELATVLALALSREKI
jgi:hypothetical protein